MTVVSHQSPEPPGRAQTLALARELLEESLAAWTAELAPLGRVLRIVWARPDEGITAVLAAAVQQAADDTGREPSDVTRCAAQAVLRAGAASGRWEPMLRRTRAGLPVGLMRAARALACPTCQGSEPSSDRGCPTVAERTGPGPLAPAWQFVHVHGRLQLRGAGAGGEGQYACRGCLARSSWLLAVPAGARDGVWVWCRCGAMEPLWGELAQIPWRRESAEQFAALAAAAGFGPLGGWGEQAPEADLALPGASRDGDECWRHAARLAAGAVRAGQRHLEYVETLLLTAVILYTASRAAGMPVDQVDLGAACAAPPAALRAALDRALPAPAPRRPALPGLPPPAWPDLQAYPDPDREPSDPASQAWALLTDPDAPGLFERAHRHVMELAAPAR